MASPLHAPPRTPAELRPWQRFHMRLTAAYGLLVFLILSGASLAFYEQWLRSEMDGLKGRLRWLAVGVASSIHAHRVAEFNDEGDTGSKQYQKLSGRFAQIGAGMPDLVRISLLRPTERAGWLRYAVDYRPGAQRAPVGELYDASAAPLLLAGLRAPTVEQEPRGPDGAALSAYAPVLEGDGTSTGVVSVSLSLERVQQIRRRVLWITGAVYGVAAALLGVIAWLVGRNVQAPLGRLTAATTAIAAGELHVRAAIERPDEFGILGRHFDQMAAGLQEREYIRDTLGRYVSPEVARKVLSDRSAARLGGEERVVTILLSDLRGYSTLSEHLSPTQVVELLNEYLAAMGALIDAQEGCVIEFLGDGILAVFGAPVEQPDHAARAARCALAMRARLEELNRGWAERGLSRRWAAAGEAEIRARIGLHSGCVVAGNLGSRTRVKYAVIGDAVNVAARCEALNKELGTEILLTEAMRALLPEDLAAPARPQGEHHLRGRAQPVTLWSL